MNFDTLYFEMEQVVVNTYFTFLWIIVSGLPLINQGFLSVQLFVCQLFLVEITVTSLPLFSEIS